MDDTHAVAADGGRPGRRGFLGCMAWAGAGVLWTVSGGVPRSRLVGAAQAAPAGAAQGGLSFMQISDSHIGFANAPTPTPPARCARQWRWWRSRRATRRS